MIPVADWGRDHWTTFAYLAHVIVNEQGQPNILKMRCDRDLHPVLAGSHVMRSQKKYPTQLRRNPDGTRRLQEDHDDWSCCEDFAEVGLVEEIGTGTHPVYRFTELGWKLWFDFQRHIADHPGAWSGTYTPPAFLLTGEVPCASAAT